MQRWKALPELERKDYEERASEEQKKYMNDCIAKYEQKQQGNGACESSQIYNIPSFDLQRDWSAYQAMRRRRRRSSLQSVSERMSSQCSCLYHA